MIAFYLKQGKVMPLLRTFSVPLRSFLQSFANFSHRR